MIATNNKFEDNFLKIEFTGDAIDPKIISITTTDDVDFKDLVDYLVQLIPYETELEIIFEDYDNQDHKEKLDLIKETTTEIYKHFNSSITEIKVAENPSLGVGQNPQEGLVSDDGLPF